MQQAGRRAGFVLLGALLGPFALALSNPTAAAASHVVAAQQEQEEPTDTAPPADTILDESWEDITPDRIGPAEMKLPVGEGMEGPSVVAAQVLLDQNRFSPGVIDGYWGANTEKAVYWYEDRHGLSPDGTLDGQTLDDLLEGRGERPLLRRTTLTQDDVSGPFVRLPEDIYERAEMDCLCYESLAEKLGERFHTTPRLLRKLNPGVDLNTVAAGDELVVPNVETDSDPPTEAPVEEIVISDGGHYLHARDGDGRLLYHFPAVLGADYAPSPSGNYTITSVTFDPSWHYQPDLLSGVDPSRPDAVLPPGPNNAVGVVWMQLSRPHYGIHGTSAPATVGYADSHGCVRLTNWDAMFLAERVEEGVPVRFQDTAGRTADGPETARAPGAADAPDAFSPRAHR